MRMQLRLGLTPRDPILTLRQTPLLGVARSDHPIENTRIRLNDRTVSEARFWEAWQSLPLPNHALMRWRYDEEMDWWGHLGWDGSSAKVQNTNYSYTPTTLLALLNRVDFTVANTAVAYPRWWYEPEVYHAPGMSDGHFANGSFGAFSKEDGHARLVSRRWLDHGPWRLLRDEETDLSLVQYHDLDAPEDVALEQAKLGHQTMGIAQHGGFIQKRYPFGRLKPSRYDRAGRTSIVLVVGQQPVSYQNMLEAAALKLWQPHADHAIDQVAFVFTDEGNARKHLKDLWLRGLEVRFVDQRLDDAFEPGPPVVPDWVKSVQDREGV